MATDQGFYKAVKAHVHSYEPKSVAALFVKTDRDRVNALSAAISEYIERNLSRAIAAREGLPDYRTNPYVLLTCASVMKLVEPDRFASFLFNNKLYMGLETSFGKSIESVLVQPYPLGAKSTHRWEAPIEKQRENKDLEGLSAEKKAEQRIESVWREIDKAVVIGTKRYLLTIKSGPSCINDTQVIGMTDTIAGQYRTWVKESKLTYPGIKELDIVVGITYGTDKTTNNKENQILVKLKQRGFEEEDRETRPGVLIDSATRSVRVYRCIGIDFWSFVGSPLNPKGAAFVYLEVLLALAKALNQGKTAASLEERINQRVRHLAQELTKLTFPRSSLPTWVRQEFDEPELFWLATGMTAFYDQGI